MHDNKPQSLPRRTRAALVGGILSSIVWVLLAVAPGRVQAEDGPQGEETRYFYLGLPYGSDATFHPVRELINGSLGILQISSNWKSLDEIDWGNGFDITWESITHPVRTVDSYGRKEFLTSEVVPGELRWSNLQYVPNYHLHLIGGGARNRAFTEWYEAHGFSHAGIWAMATTVLHAFAVETVEHQAGRGPTVDPVADMLLFDPAGALLFTSDGVARFFSKTLNMSIWSGQPMYNPVQNTIENAGENYGLHFFPVKDRRLGLFMYWGMCDLIGLTVRSGGGLDWSVGVGGMVTELQEEERGTGMSAFYARLSWDVGAFLHRNGSLLASIHVSEAWSQTLRINLFPGLVSWRGVSPGVYVGVRHSDAIVGVSLISIPLGLAVSQ
jgi:hypothetical protein